MDTQQAYINGFVKRAAEYGYSEQEAVSILKKANLMDSIKDIPNRLGGYVNNLKDQATSGIYNAQVGGLTEGMGLPQHIADYGMKNLNSNDLQEGVKNLFTNKYNSDVFGAEHPILNQASEFLKSHDIDPTTAAMVAGGTGLLGGGYLLGKHLNNKKQPQQNRQQFEE